MFTTRRNVDCTVFLGVHSFSLEERHFAKIARSLFEEQSVKLANALIVHLEHQWRTLSQGPQACVERGALILSLISRSVSLPTPWSISPESTRIFKQNQHLLI